MTTPSAPALLHIDTDFAGNPDDACAIAMLCGWPDIELVGMTTAADPDGRRAGYLDFFLALLGRRDIPVVAGAGYSTTTGRAMGDIADHQVFWGTPTRPPPRLPEPQRAVEMLDASIALGATVVAIGPCTNLAMIEKAHPGRLAQASVVVMGGWLDPLGDRLPPWGPGRDWNVVCDPLAAATVAATAGELTWCPIPGAIGAQLRTRDLPRLVASGPVGDLLGRQVVAHGERRRHAELAERHRGLGPDLVAFLWDPVTCATALGWDGAEVVEIGADIVPEAGGLRLVRSTAGRRTRVVVGVDGEAFVERWLGAVETAQRGSDAAYCQEPRAGA